MESEKKYQTLHMCDFCSREIETCGAQPVYLKNLSWEGCPLGNGDNVIACNDYESPVEVLRKKFH